MESEFGAALRAWRDRLSPHELGLPTGARRRASGLRREELAGLAGISVDYLTRLEQGRAQGPSDQVVAALARALRLSDRERGLLFGLAGVAQPGPGMIPRHVAPSVQRMLDRFTGTPVIVFDASWTLISANDAYRAVMGDTSAWVGHEANGVWRAFTGAGTRARLTAEESEEQRRRLVLDLRLAAARYPGDPRLRDLIRDLRRRSPDFGELWDEPGGESAPARRKVIDHPEVGPIGLDCDTVEVAGDDLRVMIYTAVPGTEDASRLALAVALGVQPQAASGDGSGRRSSR
ncbi:helix-turn-helix transcriptional regulator [Microbacterium soli]|uniref:Helix-turn-helix transcriptional regulator n=1 Tax=Microbacterium soli TaxID=446075 RepID=A0ABP7NDZ0_9MICO